MTTPIKNDNGEHKPFAPGDKLDVSAIPVSDAAGNQASVDSEGIFVPAPAAPTLEHWAETEQTQGSQWTPVHADANRAAIIKPKGSGALQASETGNLRGTYATDLQMSRANATQVASGNLSVITGGRDNTASGQEAFVGCGNNNTASAAQSAVLSGIQNQVTGINGVVLGGNGNTVVSPSSRGAIATGELNTITAGQNGFIGGGRNNTVSTNYASVVTGRNNSATGQHSAVLAGGGTAVVQGNTASGNASAVVAGTNNIASGAASVILGGSHGRATSGSVIHATIDIQHRAYAAAGLSAAIPGVAPPDMTIALMKVTAYSNVEASWYEGVFPYTTDSSGVLTLTGGAQTLDRIAGSGAATFPIAANGGMTNARANYQFFENQIP